MKRSPAPAFQPKLKLNKALTLTLVRHAERRGISASMLVQLIIQTVLADDIVDAVLDDGAAE